MMPFNSFVNEFFSIVSCLWILAEHYALSDDIFKPGTGLDTRSTDSVDLTETLVAGDQPILIIPHDKAVRHCLDRPIKEISRPFLLRFDPLALTQCCVKRAREREDE